MKRVSDRPLRAKLPAACPAALLLVLAGCGDTAPAGPERPTVGEARAVGEAAEMLDERPDESPPAAAQSPVAAQQ